jgi:PTH1 family peptidyl-tRNA hydrolase
MIDGEKVLLIKPQTFMNLSGQAIKPALDFYKIPPENLFLICDDVNIPLGTLRIREKGSAGGHNGLKNIISHLGHDGFIRIKMGVGEKPKGYDLADYVLGHFSKDERVVMDKACDRAVDAIRKIISEDADAAMNEYNKKTVE